MQSTAVGRAGVFLLGCAVVLGAVVGFVGATPTGASPPPERWNETYGGAESDASRAVVATSDGGYLSAGLTSSFGANRSAAWLLKVDAAGVEEWNRTYGGTDERIDRADAVIETADGGYLFAGATRQYRTGDSDAWLLRVDAAGVEAWNRTYGGSDFDLVSSVRATSDGGYLLGGYTRSYADGGFDAWLVKVDAAGVEAWNRTYGASDADFGGPAVEVADGYLFTGSTGSYGVGEADAWLVKVDDSGVEAWNRTYGVSDADRSYDLVETSDGHYLLAGFTGVVAGGLTDAWLVKVDATGEEVWNRTYGGASFDLFRSVLATSDGGYLLAGRTGSDGVDRSDAWLVKVDAAGEEVWNRTYGGESPETFETAVRASDGGYLLAGSTESYGAGDADAWLVKIGGSRPTVEVSVDIRPGSDRNPVNPRSNGVVPVAILDTSSFDPATVDVATLEFGASGVVGGNGATAVHGGHYRDVDGDGDFDLVVHFDARAAGFGPGDTEGVLVGTTVDGAAIEGSDGVTVVGPPNRGR